MSKPEPKPFEIFVTPPKTGRGLKSGREVLIYITIENARTLLNTGKVTLETNGDLGKRIYHLVVVPTIANENIKEQTE